MIATERSLADYPYMQVIQGDNPEAEGAFCYFDAVPSPLPDSVALPVAHAARQGGSVFLVASTEEVLDQATAAVSDLVCELQPDDAPARPTIH